MAAWTSSRSILLRILEPFWLYAEPHHPLPGVSDEYEFWKQRIDKGFAHAIDELAVASMWKRRWIDDAGNKQETNKDYLRQQLKSRIAYRTKVLDILILALSYDLAVLQANYTIDRGLRGKVANQLYLDESAPLIERVKLSWWQSSRRLGLSWRKQEKDSSEEFVGKLRFRQLAK